MTAEQSAAEIREAVGVFLDADTLQAAIDELLESGFDRAHLSLLASESTVESKLGHRYEKVADAEDDAFVPRTAYVSPEALGDAEGGLVGALLYVGGTAAAGAVVASGGTLAAVIAAAALAGGAGGLVGSLLARWLDRRHAHYLQEQLDRGGLLLWVRTVDAEHERRALEILGRHSGRDVHVHAFPDLPAAAAASRSPGS
jgi:hypothetical protein